MSESASSQPYIDELLSRLLEPRHFIQILARGKQVERTAIAIQAADLSGLPYRLSSTDEPGPCDLEWIERQRETARLLELETRSEEKGTLLILNEVQKVPLWADMVKYLWDTDSREYRKLKVVVLMSELLPYRSPEALDGSFRTHPSATLKPKSHQLAFQSLGPIYLVFRYLHSIRQFRDG